MHQWTTRHQDVWRAALYDLDILRSIERQIVRVQAAPAPLLELITAPSQPESAAPILLLPGAFNPLTTAHLALAESALQTSGTGTFFCLLSTRTINKEGTERATLLDRLLLLRLVAQRLGFLGVLVTNRGLYVEQAEAARAAFPGASALRFVVGFDKIEQIIDARYYTDRNAALKRLFALASLLVAPRASHAADDVSALMQRPENQAFQPFVSMIALPVDMRAIASSQVRAAFQQPSGGNQAADVPASLHAWLPPEVSSFCVETRCYFPPLVLPTGERIDHYRLREALIQHALTLPQAQQALLHLRLLFRLATSPTPAGQALRTWLQNAEHAQAAHDLLSFQRQNAALGAQDEANDLTS